MANYPNTSTQMINPPEARRGILGNRERRDVAADISRLIGQNVRAARKQQGYSLQTLAWRSGVSRAMLGQIETAKSVPTVTVMWRIAAALDVPINALLSNGASEPAVIVRAGYPSSPGPKGVRAIVAPGRDGEPRFFEIGLAAGQSDGLPAHAASLGASLIVVRGRLRIDFQGQDGIELADGDLSFFEALSPFTIANIGSEPALAYLALTPKRTF